MTQRTTGEVIVMAIGAVVALVAAALLGLTGYVIVESSGLPGLDGYLFGTGIFGLVVLTLVYASAGLGRWRDAQYRRPN